MGLPDKFETESEAVAFLEAFFSSRQLNYAREFPTGAGRIDFVLRCRKSARPLLGIEVKKGLTSESNLREFGDPFEQAAVYSRALQIPVLLGPILVDNATPMTVGHGGHQIEAYKTISIFAGRVNVGGFFFDRREQWVMMMRGIAIWSSRGQFNADAMRLVSSTNSQKTRKSA